MRISIESSPGRVSYVLAASGVEFLEPIKMHQFRNSKSNKLIDLDFYLYEQRRMEMPKPAGDK
jgi:hypothetical protein